MSYLGKFLVEQGAITEAQLEDGLNFQRESNHRIGQMAVDKGLLTPEAVQEICQTQRDDAGLFGDIAVRERRLTRRSLDDLLFLQKVHYTYLGEALLVRGHITEDQYRLLLGRHYALLDNQRVSLRYLNEFFAENRFLDILVLAMGRAVRRFVSGPMTINGVGIPFAPEAFPARALVEGVVLGNRRLAANLCLSAQLADALASDTRDSEIPYLEVFFNAVIHFFKDLLRDEGFLLADERVCLGSSGAITPEECTFVRCQCPLGEVGIVLWLAEGGA